MSELEKQLKRIAHTQCDAGWSEASIASYAKEVTTQWGHLVEDHSVSLGAGLAQDNTRHGVPNKPRSRYNV